MIDLKNIKGITDDSRKVKSGYIFVAIKGITVDGHDYIYDAIEKGAKIIVGEQDLDLEGVIYKKVKDSRLELGLLASKFYKEPSKKLKIIGVTGTDGKTTTANIIYHILKTARKKVGLISTINAKIGDKEYDTGFHVTSPESVMLQELLAKMVEAGCEYAVLEVTSHGLDQKRFAGVNFEVGVLTNITHEHLDYHKTMKNYIAAKGKLFTEVKYAVLNGKNKSSSYILPFVNKKAETFLYYFEKLNKPLKVAVSNRFPESYNQENATAAIATTRILGVNRKEMLLAIKTFPQLSGRMEEVKNDKNIKIYIDFAHTPSALESVLKEISSKKKVGKLIAIFGCASERDVEKRPLMAEISTRLADVSVFTAEDPRNEDINDIFNDMEEGVINKQAVIYKIADRQEAINFAINEIAEKEDTIVICGKGHEKSMNIGGIEIPWSDKAAVERTLKII